MTNDELFDLKITFSYNISKWFNVLFCDCYYKESRFAEGEGEEEDNVSIPHISLEVNDPENPGCKQVMELGSDILPSVEDVSSSRFTES